MAKTKPKARPQKTPWLRFLAALDADTKSGGIVRGWLDDGRDLRRIFTYASGPANAHVAAALASDLDSKRRRGAAYRAGARKAIKGLDAMIAALGNAPELGAARLEAEAMADVLRTRMDRAPEAFGVKRLGSSVHTDAFLLSALRAYTGASVGEVVRVAGVAVRAHNDRTSFSPEAAEKALRRFEENNPRMLAMLAASAGGSR